MGQVVGWGVLYYSPLVAISAVSQQEGWNLRTLTALLSIGLLVAAVAGIYVGRLLDRLSPRRVLVAGASMGVVGMVMFASATSTASLAISLVVVGLGQSAVLYQAAFTVATHRYRQSLDFSLTVITIAGGLSSAVFAPIVVGMLTELGWRATFGLLAGVMAMLIPIYFHWLPRDAPGGQSDPLESDLSEQQSVAVTMRTGRFLRLGVILVVTTVAIFSVTFLAIPLFEEKGLNFEQAAWLFAAIGFGQVFGRLGLLFFRLDRAPRLLLAFVALGSGAGIAGFVVVGDYLPVLMIVALLVGGLRGAHTLVQATAISVRWGRQHFGTLNGVLSAPLSVALALAPAIGGQIAHVMSSYNSMALVMAAVLILVAPLARYT